MRTRDRKHRWIYFLPKAPVLVDIQAVHYDKALRFEPDTKHWEIFEVNKEGIGFKPIDRKEAQQWLGCWGYTSEEIRYLMSKKKK